MTCREFKDAAELLTPSRVLRLEDEALLSHSVECPACGAWLNEQRSLGHALLTLQERTAEREAGPNVEATLLRAFRMGNLVAAPVTMDRAAPTARRLSRLFEVGAYVAAAAALLIAILLGTRVWRTQGEEQPQALVPVVTQPQSHASGGQTEAAKTTAPDDSANMAVKSLRTVATRGATTQPKESQDPTLAKAEDNQGYVDLMLCDPLICSGNTQVVRMELPASSFGPADSSELPVVADVVVGDDGLVRAYRIVNSN